MLETAPGYARGLCLRQMSGDTPWAFLKAEERWKADPNPAVSAMEARVSSPEVIMRLARASRERSKKRYQKNLPACSEGDRDIF